ncbi:MAG: hypothetical protein PW843_23320 [Azospirillaceae bacterium]|nr:hypothetical protein [Azospirillaceae bacterium]
MMGKRGAIAALAVVAGAGLSVAMAGRAETAGVSVERGRYITIIAGCNDCHTEGYAKSGGTLPPTAWLKGDPVGHQGPWGTTYAVNLRLYLRDVSEDEWVARVRAMKTRPTMPWFNMRVMEEADVRSLYRFIRSLPGDAGPPMPDYVAPGDRPTTPVTVHVPQPPQP